MQILPPEPVPLFTYWDGLQHVHADHGAIFRQLLIRTRGKPNELSNKYYAVKPDTTDEIALMESHEAGEQLVQLVRELFQMQPFNRLTGQGAHDENCFDVWRSFCEFIAESKKKTVTSPTTSAPSAIPADSPPIMSNT